MKHLFIFLILGNALALAACSTPIAKNYNSIFYSVPVNSTLTLNKDITIPANLARRFFQNGKAIKESDVNIYYPHCSILMDTLVDYERTIKPTTFKIYKILDDEQEARLYIKFASNFIKVNDGPIIVGFVSYYYLRSANNPDINSLECVQWNDPYIDEYLTVNEIKKSLGDYFTLQIND